jgi:1,2-beta-oligoglucan phosphorylase
MARDGDVEAFFLALRQAHLIALRLVVPPAALRQANGYDSSVDAALADRSEAPEPYDTVQTGAVAMEEGWRIDLSGAGTAMRLMHQYCLGLRWEPSALIIDPVIPDALDGLYAGGALAGSKVQITYRIGGAGYGPNAVILNGHELSSLAAHSLWP